MIIITALSDCKRGEPLTTRRPYGLLPIANKKLIEHQIERLGEKNVVLLVNKKSASIKEVLSEEYNKTSIKYVYVEDSETKEIERLLTQNSIILPGDLLVDFKKITLPKGSGQFLVECEDGSEESSATKGLLVSLGLKLPEIALENQYVERINYPWELLNANQRVCEELKNIETGNHNLKEKEKEKDKNKRFTTVAKSAIIEENVVIKGYVVVGEKTIIRSDSYIEGPVIIGNNCTIGPLAHLRPHTSIGNDCTIGKSEVVDAVIMDKSVSKHNAYIGHSVLCENVNVGAFTVTADYRHDAGKHNTIVYTDKGVEKVMTKRRKLGAFIGDDCRLAITTNIYPGRKLWPGETTLPGEVVKRDKRGV